MIPKAVESNEFILYYYNISANPFIIQPSSGEHDLNKERTLFPEIGDKHKRNEGNHINEFSLFSTTPGLSYTDILPNSLFADQF